MKRFTLVLLTLFLTVQSMAAELSIEHRLLRETTRINELQKVISASLIQRKCHSFQQTNHCPKVLLESLKDIYTNGTVGNINYLISNGKLRDPRSACSSSAKYLRKSDPAKLENQIKRKFPNDQSLSGFAQVCKNEYQESIEAERESEDQQLAYSYLIYDFNYKNNLIQNGLLNLIDSKNQMNAIIGGENQDCTILSGKKLVRRCQTINNCSHKSQKKLFTIKANELRQDFDKLLLLQNEYNKLRNQRGHITSYSRAKEISEAIQTIEHANPLLKGEYFKRYRNKYKRKLAYKATNAPKIDPFAFSSVVKEQLKSASKQIDSKISNFIRAQKCLSGKEHDCSDFNKIIKNAKYNPPAFYLENSPEINNAAVFHSCIENVKEARNEADKILDDVAMSTALALTPLGAIGLIKSASSMISSVRTISNLKRIGLMTTRTSMSAELGYGGLQSKNLYIECQRAKQELENFGKENSRSCQDVERLMIANSNNKRCEGQVVLTAVLMSPVAYSGFKLYKLSSGLRTDAQILSSKVRRGESLTGLEEQRLLKFYKNNNPIDKLVKTGTTTKQRSFVEQTLKRVYAQKDVHPNDLIKLSKLIKTTNPPMFMVSRFTNVESILDSKRLWGRTEGAVYSSPRPAETLSQRIKTGVIQEEGQTTFIFTPSAAALFRPHEIEGFYSGLKRAVGQHKGPFGDLIIEDHSKVIRGTTIFNGKVIPHNYVIINKARRANPKSGEKLFAIENQSAKKAALRKAGRIMTLETSAGIIAFYGWVKATEVVSKGDD